MSGIPPSRRPSSSLPAIDAADDRWTLDGQTLPASRGLSTIAVRAGRQPDSTSGSLVPALVQSTTYAQSRRYALASEDGSEGLPRSPAGHCYSRVSNPTVSALEAALGALEDAPPSVCFATGLAAETALFLALTAMGLPLLSGGRGGIAPFFGPGGGFLLGWLLSALVAGLVVARLKRRTLPVLLLAGVAGAAADYLVGVPFLGLYTGDLWSAAVQSLVYVPGDAVKVAGAAVVAATVHRALPNRPGDTIGSSGA